MEKQVKLHSERWQLNSALKAGIALAIFAEVYAVALLLPVQIALGDSGLCARPSDRELWSFTSTLEASPPPWLCQICPSPDRSQEGNDEYRSRTW